MPLPIDVAIAHAPPAARDPFRFWDPWYEKDPGWSIGDLKKTRASAAADPTKTPTAESRIASITAAIAAQSARGAPLYTAALLAGVDGVAAATLAGIAALEAENARIRADAVKRSEQVFGLIGAGAFGKEYTKKILVIMDAIIAFFGGAAGHPEKIRANLEAAIGCYVSCAENMLPPPLQNLGFTTLENEYWQDTEKLAAAGCAYKDKLMALPPESVMRLRGWWALLTKNVQHPAVREMLLYTRWGDLGLAHDEQVYMVAVVVAAEMKLDPQAFARRLWTESAGWQGAPETMRQHLEGYVSNAAQLQWDVLISDAYRIAGVGPAPSAPSKPSGGGGPLLGLIGTIALVALGAPIVAALVPLAVGIVWAGRGGPTVGSAGGGDRAAVVGSGCGCQHRHKHPDRR